MAATSMMPVAASSCYTKYDYSDVCIRPTTIRRHVVSVSHMAASSCSISTEKRRSLTTSAVMSTDSSRVESLHHDQSSSNIRILSGGAHPALSKEICEYMGLDLGRVLLKTFADGELYVKLLDSVRGRDVYIVQPTCKPANDHIMQLTMMIDACRRDAAKSITAVIPYFGYSRADRMKDKEAMAAKLVADQITNAGCNELLVMDFHAEQAMGFFNKPVKHVSGGLPVIIDYLVTKGLSKKDLVVVSPDTGGTARARLFADNLPVAVNYKFRPDHNVVEVMNLFGDVKGKVAIMFDDIIDTAGTMAKGAALLREKGAKEVYGCATHAVFSPPAIERLSASGLFNEVIVTNSIPISEKNYFPQLTVLSVANIISQKISEMQNPELHEDFLY